MKKFQLAFLLLFLSLVSLAQMPGDIMGIWINPNNDGKVKIFKSGDLFYGNLIWLKNPNKDGKPKIDDKNPDENKRKRKLQGLLILTGFTFNPDERIWESGQIYDPNNGKLYSCKMTLEGKDKLRIRGFIGISLIGRTEVWRRVQ